LAVPVASAGPGLSLSAALPEAWLVPLAVVVALAEGHLEAREEGVVEGVPVKGAVSVTAAVAEAVLQGVAVAVALVQRVSVAVPLPPCARQAAQAPKPPQPVKEAEDDS
jgi:hypothetical protein